MLGEDRLRRSKCSESICNYHQKGRQYKKCEQCWKNIVCNSVTRITVSLKIEQHVNLRFIVKLEKSPTECCSLLKEVLKDYVLKFLVTQEFFSEDLEEGPGQPSMSR